MSEVAERESGEVRDGYKRVQLGPKEVEIPDEWRVSTFGESCEIVNGGTPKKKNEEYWGGGLVWVTPTDLTEDIHKYIDDSKEKITEEGLNFSSATLLEPGAVLMSSRATIGEVAINTVPVTTNQGFKSLVPDEDLESEYLYYYIPRIADYLNEIGGGSTFSEISKTDTESIRIPLPPLSEQRRIAAVLSTVDEEIRQTEEVIETTEELKRGLMQDLFSTGVQNSAKTKTVRIGPKEVEIQEDWEVKRVDELVPEDEKGIRAGPFGSKVKQEHLVTEGVKLYEKRNVYQSDFEVGNRYVTEDRYESELSSYTVEPGDVLVTLQGTIGDTTVVPEDAEKGIINPKLMIIRLRSTLCLPRFFAQFFRNSSISKNQIEAVSHGAVVSGLNITTVSGIRIPLPPVSEQKEIIDIISSAESRISAEEKRKQKLQELKRALMQDLLTGKKRPNIEVE